MLACIYSATEPNRIPTHYDFPFMTDTWISECCCPQESHKHCMGLAMALLLLNENYYGESPLTEKE